MEQDIFDKAQQIIDETGNYSISYLQRKLAIGYNRASKIMENIKIELFFNEDLLFERLELFLVFFTKEELLLCLKNMSYMNQNELRFF